MTEAELEKALHDARYFRANTYPTVQDQLDMLWHMIDTDVIPGKTSTWYLAIKEVKENNQKPAPL